MQMIILFGAALLCAGDSADATAQNATVDVQHVKVYYEPGRFGGWPANHGIWHWDNEILVGFSQGYYKDRGNHHHFDPDKPEDHLLARSRDGGETWELEYPTQKGFLIPRGRALHGTELPDVPIPEPRACPGGIDFTHPDFAMTVRMTAVGSGFSRFEYSYDRGHSWEGPFLLPQFDTPGIAARTDYIVDSPHSCTLFLTGSKEDGREGRPLCVRTEDGGATWQFLSWIGPEPTAYTIMPATVRLSDSDLLTIIRTREGNRNWLAAYRSTDNGQSWEHYNDPADDVGHGNPAAIIRLMDGRLCLTYGYRAEPFGIHARLSSDEGHSWSDAIVLRDDGLSRDIGYPRMVQRPDGKVVVVYYYCDPATGPERYIAATLWTPPAPAAE